LELTHLIISEAQLEYAPMIKSEYSQGRLVDVLGEEVAENCGPRADELITYYMT
jgi:hypothetical protein